MTNLPANINLKCKYVSYRLPIDSNQFVLVVGSPKQIDLFADRISNCEFRDGWLDYIETVECGSSKAHPINKGVNIAFTHTIYSSEMPRRATIPV